MPFTIKGATIKESPVFVKTYDFTKWLLEHTIKFPKSQRFVMAKRIEKAILNFYDLLLLAVKQTDKKEVLQKASFELERVKHYLRLCKDLGIFSIKQYEYSSKAIVEIGNLLGGWLKKV
ncbi:MAG: diversity-generating retroelement protein Avd [Deltaproteobacteria bacterium]|nr:diversity-generating retroelement protein Avd [Deltaproteobacteria bacterium]